jgi:hypothetical protein
MRVIIPTNSGFHPFEWDLEQVKCLDCSKETRASFWHLRKASGQIFASKPIERGNFKPTWSGVLKWINPSPLSRSDSGRPLGKGLGSESSIFQIYFGNGLGGGIVYGIWLVVFGRRRISVCIGDMKSGGIGRVNSIAHVDDNQLSVIMQILPFRNIHSNKWGIF